MSLLLIIHTFVTLAMIGAILLQRSEGGGLSGLGGASSTGGAFTARGAANLLTRVTGVLAAIFFANCLLMGVISKNQAQQGVSLLQEPAQEQK